MLGSQIKRLIFVLSLLTFSGNLYADLSLPHFFSDHMVLQRERDASIWGKASPNAEVTLKFRDASVRVKADRAGNWRASIATGKAHDEGASLTVTADGETVTIKDVLVGEVWFASGQSNMVFTMDRVPAYGDLIKKSDHPKIRMFNAPMVTAVAPQQDIEGAWTLAQPKTVGQYSAVAFFFARRLHEELGVPIGVIKSAWGGKPVETFTSRKALSTLPAAKKLVDAAVADDANYDAVKAKAAYEKRLVQWKNLDAAWREKPAADRGRRPRRPAVPKRALDTEGKPGVLFNSMINPFVGYTIRGAIWYQGEGNAKPGAVPYDRTLPLLINDWRDRWGDDFSFYFVQLANFRDPSTEPGNNDPWPLLQDRMRRILDSTPNTGMAIINDVGEAKDIHPKNKHDVGNRLALWALAKDYGRDIIYSGPLYRSSMVKGDTIHVQFDHVGKGLKVRNDGPLKRFEIAGKDQAWHWAEAKIISPSVVAVSSPQVPNPVAVRYAWAANPEGANLVNSAGLPASVFRTDSWNDVEVPVDRAAQQRLEQRRALATEIKTLAAKRTTLEQGSEQYKQITAKQRELLKRFKAIAR